MAGEPLLDAAGQIADGADVDWLSISSTLSSADEQGVADEMAVVARIAAGHRRLHEVLPAGPDTPTVLVSSRSRWGHLDLLDVVGRGSYGTVYRAWDSRLERLVALKLFHGAPDPGAVMQEGRMLARVRHQHVVTVYGADIVDHVAGLWMELIHGQTLDVVVKRDGPMTAQAAAAVGMDVARALEAVHGARLLHCDVKAQNVVLEAGGRVVLMDLGAGRVEPEARDSDQLSDVAGTPRYMAPELFHAGAEATKATDIYSLGVLLYYLVSGKFPVDGKSLGELKQSHLAGRVTPLDAVCPDAPPFYLALVSRALETDPQKRPASAADVAVALAPLAEPALEKPVRLRSAGWWVAAAVGVGLLATLLLRPLLVPAAPALRSIAVLPIRNLTGDPSKAYVADGLTEVLISNLARVRALRVPSFAAVSPFRGSEESPSALGQKLGVQLLLAGSVTQADTKVRMAVQLIDAATGTAMWGEELTREPSGMLSAQAEIARMIANRLALKLGKEETEALTQRAVDPRAQDAYLNGLALMARTPSHDQDAARAFRMAVELQPDFAAAWAELALAETTLANQVAAVDRAERARFVKDLAQRAITLDGGRAAGYVALGTAQFYFDWDLVSAERNLRRAFEVEPSNAVARQRLSMLLAALGRLDEAITIMSEAEALEPLVSSRATSLGMVYYYARDYERALAKHQRSLVLAPDSGVGHSGIGRVLMALGRYDDAVAEFRLALKSANYAAWLVEVAQAYAAGGRRAEAEEVVAELAVREKAGETVSIDNFAYIAGSEGRLDDAFAILDQAIERKSTNILWIAVDPRADPLRSDPRFDRVLARIGLRR